MSPEVALQLAALRVQPEVDYKTFLSQEYLNIDLKRRHDLPTSDLDVFQKSNQFVKLTSQNLETLSPSDLLTVFDWGGFEI